MSLHEQFGHRKEPESRLAWTQSLVAAIAVVALSVPATAAAEVRVAATVGDLAAAVREVGGDRVSVTTLARPAEDPHYVDAKPSYVRELSRADLLVVNGMSLEVGWLPTLIDSARNADIQEGSDGYFDASSVVEAMGVPDTEVTRKMGDVHPEGNPHYTLDPRQMARVAIGLGKRLGKIDEAHADAYMERARSFAKSCLKTAKKWEEKFASLDDGRRRITVYHENWDYVFDWLGLEKVATVEPKPGVEPNPKHVGKVVEAISSDGARAVVKMEYYPSSTVETIAEKTDVPVVTSAGHAEEGEGYIDRIDRLAGSLYEAISADEQ